MEYPNLTFPTAGYLDADWALTPRAVKWLSHAAGVPLLTASRY